MTGIMIEISRVLDKECVDFGINWVETNFILCQVYDYWKHHNNVEAGLINIVEDEIDW